VVEHWHADAFVDPSVCALARPTPLLGDLAPAAVEPLQRERADAELELVGRRRAQGVGDLRDLQLDVGERVVVDGQLPHGDVRGVHDTEARHARVKPELGGAVGRAADGQVARAEDLEVDGAGDAARGQQEVVVARAIAASSWAWTAAHELDAGGGRPATPTSAAAASRPVAIGRSWGRSDGVGVGPARCGPQAWRLDEIATRNSSYTCSL
jgi:hypothetical protein